MASNKTPIIIGAAVGGGLLLALGATKGKDAVSYVKSHYTKGGNMNPPKDLLELATKWSKKFGAPTSLLVALMGIESSYNPKASNMTANAIANGKGGAWGLTQLLLRDARDIYKNPALSSQVKWNGEANGLLDPNTHLAIAAFKLAQNWKRYRGKRNNWLTTGIAWHQGTGNVDKDIAKGGGTLNPAQLPPNGREYYARLEKQLDSNAYVAEIKNQEASQYAFV